MIGHGGEPEQSPSPVPFSQRSAGNLWGEPTGRRVPGEADADFAVYATFGDRVVPDHSNVSQGEDGLILKSPGRRVSGPAGVESFGVQLDCHYIIGADCDDQLATNVVLVEHDCGQAAWRARRARRIGLQRW